MWLGIAQCFYQNKVGQCRTMPWCLRLVHSLTHLRPVFIHGSVQTHINTSLSPCRAIHKGPVMAIIFFFLFHTLQPTLEDNVVCIYYFLFEILELKTDIQQYPSLCKALLKYSLCLMTAFMLAAVCKRGNKGIGNFSGLICHSFCGQYDSMMSAPPSLSVFT